MENYLNPITVSCHFMAYIVLSICAFRLHQPLQNLSKNNYPIGCVEVVVFMFVPFFYIFWNAYSIEKACRFLSTYQSNAEFPRIIGLSVPTWVILIVSPLVFPDNMDKVCPFISILGFVIAFLVFWLLQRQLMRVLKQANL